MRLRIFLRIAFLLFAVASPLALRAQFQDPTPDELKMISDPKAPGASAVYLYREETTDDTAHFHGIYERIKVLTEKGKELATVHVPYEKGEFKVTKIEGRTIHSDGTVIPLTVKPDDLVEFKTKGYQENSIVFTLPSVEVGSILEYRLQIHYNEGIIDPPRWNIQQTYYVRKAHYFFHPEPGTFLTQLFYEYLPANGPIKVERDKSGFKLDMTDVPPVPDEDWAPPLNAVRWRVEFFYSFAQSSTAFWDSAGKTWASSTEEFIKPSGTLKKAVAGMVDPGDSDEQKARKIYAAVMKLDNTDFSRVKSEAERKKDKLKEINSVDDVWKNQAGGGNAMALLYVALARVAGLKVWPMKVVDRNLGIFDPAYMDVRQLDDYIAVVVLNGKDVYVDPGQKMCPFGSLHWAHTFTTGFRETEKATVITNTPVSNYKDNSIQRAADLTIDSDGAVKGTVRYVLTGAEALHWRQIALENDPEEVKRQFNESMRDDLPEGVEADFDHFLELENYESNLMGVVKVSGVVGGATGKHFFLPGLFFESRAKHPFVAQDKRTTPIDVHYPRMEQDDVTYHLPPGYTVESAPHTADVKWMGYAALRIDSVPKGDSLEVARAFGRNFTALKPEAYNELHDFYLKLAAADQQQIVLTRAASTKGNQP